MSWQPYFEVLLQELEKAKIMTDYNPIVTFRYEMFIHHEDGTQTRQVEESKPLTVMFGRGNLLEPFEKKLIGLKENDTFDFMLKSTDTFGPHQSHAVQDFDKKEMLEGTDYGDMEIEKDMYLPMETEEGTPFNGKVVDIQGDKITLDFNHPLAGKDLHFRGEIISVREPTPEELQAGKHLPNTNNLSSK